MAGTSLNNVTGDIAYSIFAHLSPPDLASLAAVSDHCRVYAQDDLLWRRFAPYAPSGQARYYHLCERAWHSGRAIRLPKLYIPSLNAFNVHLQQSGCSTTVAGGTKKSAAMRTNDAGAARCIIVGSKQFNGGVDENKGFDGYDNDDNDEDCYQYAHVYNDDNVDVDVFDHNTRNDTDDGGGNNNNNMKKNQVDVQKGEIRQTIVHVPYNPRLIASRYANDSQNLLVASASKGIDSQVHVWSADMSTSTTTTERNGVDTDDDKETDDTDSEQQLGLHADSDVDEVDQLCRHRRRRKKPFRKKVKRLFSLNHPLIADGKLSAICVTSLPSNYSNYSADGSDDDDGNDNALVLTGTDLGKVYYGVKQKQRHHNYHHHNYHHHHQQNRRQRHRHLHDMQRLYINDENNDTQMNCNDRINAMSVEHDDDFESTTTDINNSGGHMSSNGRLAVGTSGGRVCILDIESGTQVTELIGSCSCAISSVCSAGMRRNGLVVAGIAHQYSGNGHGALGISWDVRTKSRIHTYYRPNHKRSYLAFDTNVAPKVQADASGHRLCVFTKHQLYAFDVRMHSSCIFDFQQDNDDQFHHISHCDLNYERLAFVSMSTVQTGPTTTTTTASGRYRTPMQQMQQQQQQQSTVVSTSVNVFDFRRAVVSYDPQQVNRFVTSSQFHSSPRRRRQYR